MKEIELGYALHREAPVMQLFGANAKTYKKLGQEGHNGIDLGVHVGTIVLAMADGVVRHAGEGVDEVIMGSAAGTCVVLEHGGLKTGYAHLSRLYCRKGQSVVKGQIIGLSGATGAVTGPHLHLEVIKEGIGVSWVAEYVAGIYSRRNVRAVVIDSKGPAGSTIEVLKSMEVPVTTLNMTSMVQACGHFYDLVMSDEIRHFRQNELNNAVAGARKRKLVDAWAWHRQSVNTNITPLVAATAALYGLTVAAPAKAAVAKPQKVRVSNTYYGFN